MKPKPFAPKKIPAWWPFKVHLGPYPVPLGWKPATRKQKVLQCEPAPF